MTKAVEAGMPKMRIEEAAARKQARIDRGEEVVVGVNKFQLKEEDAIDIREIDNDAVRESQVARLNKIRSSRDEAKCVAALKALGEAARNGTGNLLTLSIEATRARATVGEISSALEGVYGRYQATVRSISGVYAGEWEGDAGLERIRTDIAAFAEEEGRRPRLMVVKMGQDGHDRGAKVIATAFADLGFDVDIGPLFQTPEEAARAAIENDVHVIGVSSQAAGHKTLVPQLIEELAKQGGSDVLVVVGGVIPAQDYDCRCRGDLRAGHQHPGHRRRDRLDPSPARPEAGCLEAGWTHTRTGRPRRTRHREGRVSDQMGPPGRGSIQAEDTLTAQRLAFFRRQRPLLERQYPASNGSEAGLGLELGRIADVRVVEAGQPEAHRPLSLGLGLLWRIVELAGDPLGIDLADEQVAPSTWNAGRRCRLRADFLDDDVDAALAVVALDCPVAGTVAGEADAQSRRQRVERAATLLLVDGVLRRRLPFRIVCLGHDAAGVLGNPRPRLVANDNRQ
jgi:methylmalonyl-CoA mutase cobalamin-binding domain/chain